MADLKIQTLIEILTKGKGGEDAVKVLRQLETESRKTRKGFGDTGKQSSFLEKNFGSLAKSASTVKTALAGIGVGLGAAAITRFVSDSIVGFAKEERAVNSLRFQIRGLTGDYDENVKSADKFIESLSIQTGILDDDLVPALGSALLAFDDMAQAQQVTALAAKFAANGYGDVATNVDRLTKAFQTGSVKSLREFRINTVDAAGATVDLAEGIRRVIEQADSLPDHLDDTEAKLNVVRAAADSFSEDVAKAFNKIFDVLDKIQKKQLELFHGEALAALQVSPNPLFSPPGTSPNPLRVGGAAGGESPLERAARLRREAEAKAGADKAAKKHAEDLTEKLKREAEFEKKRIQAAAEFTEEQHLEDLDAEAEFLSNMDRLSREAADAAEEARAERAEQETEAEAKARINAAEDLYALLDELDLLSSEIRLQRKLDEITAIFDASIEAARAEGKSIVDLEKQKQKALLNVKKQANDADAFLRAQKKAGELADNATIAGAAIESAINIFGNNKSLATAQAIISAITGAARAIEIYGPTPMGFAMAAVALSSGYARVRQIQATNLKTTAGGGGDATAGAGFDVPQHDRVAEVGGFRWSKDMVRNFSAGALRGMGAGWERGMMGGAWQGGGASTTTNSYDYADRSSVQVDVHVGTLIGRRGERHLARAVKRAVVRDGARGLR